MTTAAWEVVCKEATGQGKHRKVAICDAWVVSEWDRNFEFVREYALPDGAHVVHSLTPWSGERFTYYPAGWVVGA